MKGWGGGASTALTTTESQICAFMYVNFVFTTYDFHKISLILYFTYSAALKNISGLQKVA